MIKAIFFDWFNTLANFEPSREKLYSEAFHSYGYDIPVKTIMLGLLAGDYCFFAENLKPIPVKKRGSEEQIKAYSIYPREILTEAKIKAPADLPEKLIAELLPKARTLTMVLFDDVLPTMRILKEKKYITVLVTNAENSVSILCERTGLKPYLDHIVTSQEAGVEKPEPAIFQLALAKAGVRAEEVVFVGDQSKIDILGARRAGMNPVLIDRFDINTEELNCPRISSLPELLKIIPEK